MPPSPHTTFVFDDGAFTILLGLTETLEACVVPADVR